MTLNVAYKVDSVVVDIELCVVKCATVSFKLVSVAATVVLSRMALAVSSVA